VAKGKRAVLVGRKVIFGWEDQGTKEVEIAGWLADG